MPCLKFMLVCKSLGKELEIPLPPIRLFGFPEALLAQVLTPLNAPCILMLGILDGEGIWTGGLAGISRAALDFFSTFQYLWNDEPALAAKQTLRDLHELCQSVSVRFARPAGGLFIFRDEFMRLAPMRLVRE